MVLCRPGGSQHNATNAMAWCWGNGCGGCSPRCGASFYTALECCQGLFQWLPHVDYLFWNSIQKHISTSWIQIAMRSYKKLVMSYHAMAVQCRSSITVWQPPQYCIWFQGCSNWRSLPWEPVTSLWHIVLHMWHHVVVYRVFHCAQSCNIQAVVSSFLLVVYVTARSVFGQCNIDGRWMAVNIGILRWGFGGMIMGRGKRKCLGKIRVHCHSFYTNPTWIALEWSWDLLIEKPVITHLSCGTENVNR